MPEPYPSAIPCDEMRAVAADSAESCASFAASTSGCTSGCTVSAGGGGARSGSQSESASDSERAGGGEVPRGAESDAEEQGADRELVGRVVIRGWGG